MLSISIRIFIRLFVTIARFRAGAYYTPDGVAGKPVQGPVLQADQVPGGAVEDDTLARLGGQGQPVRLAQRVK